MPLGWRANFDARDAADPARRSGAPDLRGSIRRICADPDVMAFLGGGEGLRNDTEATMASVPMRGARQRRRHGGDRAQAAMAPSSARRALVSRTVVSRRSPGRLATDPGLLGPGLRQRGGRRAWLGYGFETLGRDRVIAMADTPNHRCIAVMRRLGMAFDHEARLRDGDDEFEATIYQTAGGWRRR